MKKYPLLGLISIIVISCCFVPYTHADIALIPGSQNIQVLFDGAQFVGQGVVENVKVQDQKIDENAPVARTKEVTIRVVKTYKGTRTELIRMAFQIDDSSASSSMPNLEVGDSLLLFLNQTTDGSYVFSDPYWRKLRMGMVAPADGTGPGIVQLQHDLAETLNGDDQSLSDSLILLMGFNSIDQETEQLLNRVSAQRSQKIKAQRVAVLLATRKNRYYEEALQLLRAHGTELSPLDQIAVGQRLGNPNPDVNPEILDELSKLNFVPVEIGAMQGIRKLRSTKSIPTLVGHLTDQNAFVQYLAVITLNEVLVRGDAYGPSMPEFNREPQIYISRWNQWWEKEGKMRYATSSN
jgi:hypothetical protein